MAYSYTVEQLIVAGMKRNQMNDRTKLAGNEELILFTSRRQQRAYLEVAKVNRDFWGADATVTLSGNDGSLAAVTPPIGAISRVEVAAETGNVWESGDEIHLIAVDDKGSEVNPYMYHQKDILKGTSSLSTVTSIKVYYAQITPVLDHTQSPANLDLTIPDEHMDLMISEMAWYLAMKDNRSAEELQLLAAEVADSKENLIMAAELGVGANRRF